MYAGGFKAWKPQKVKGYFFPQNISLVVTERNKNAEFLCRFLEKKILKKLLTSNFTSLCFCSLQNSREAWRDHKCTPLKKKTSQSSLQNETRAAWTCWEISRVKRLEFRPEALIYTKQSCLLPSTVAAPLPLRGRHGGELSKLSKPWLVDCCTCGKRVRVACHSHRVCVCQQ